MFPAQPTVMDPQRCLTLLKSFGFIPLGACRTERCQGDIRWRRLSEVQITEAASFRYLATISCGLHGPNRGSSSHLWLDTSFIVRRGLNQNFLCYVSPQKKTYTRS